MAVRSEADVEARVEQEKVLLAWKAPARPYRRMPKQFMTVPLVISGLVGLVLLVAGEWMLIAVVAALVFAYYAWSVVPPEDAEYALTNRGLRIHGQLMEWMNFTRWWTVDKWGHAMLIIEAPGTITGQVVMPLGDTDQKNVEEVMNKMLLREKPADTGLEKASKWLSEKFPISEER